MPPSPLFDPARHEPLRAPAWSEDAARGAIGRIVAATLEGYAPGVGWTLHPLDDPDAPGQRAHALYHGAGGVVWALRHLHARGAIDDAFERLDGLDALEAALPARVLADLGDCRHGTASWLLGESGVRLLRWRREPRADTAGRLAEIVRGNLRNPVNEPLWGNAGTVLAAVAMAEATGERAWRELVVDAIDALLDTMTFDARLGVWLWRQDLYGRSGRALLGAGHGLAGNVFAALRAAAIVPSAGVDEMLGRALGALQATALRDGRCWNWPPDADPASPPRPPLVQDCHGAPGIVCRLAAAPRTPAWDDLLDAAGEMTWAAGPLTKGASLCHGTAGSGMAMLKLWRRGGDALWLDRARALAMHAIGQVDAARAAHGRGRESLWTGDLGAACFLWGCVVGDDVFPTLDAL